MKKSKKNNKTIIVVVICLILLAVILLRETPPKESASITAIFYGRDGEVISSAELVLPETLKRTTIDEYIVGDLVNIPSGTASMTIVVDVEHVSGPPFIAELTADMKYWPL